MPLGRMPSSPEVNYHLEAPLKAYSFWNNKGGVGKSFLCFAASSEYARSHQSADVYVLDLCPQANVTETLLGGQERGAQALDQILGRRLRPTIAGYLEARISSPFVTLPTIEPYLTHVSEHNKAIPDNLFLVCGDNLLELLSEAIRQTSQLILPSDAWKRVIQWVRDLADQLAALSGEREVLVFVDCNPSFAIYTQQALIAADQIVVPFTADDSSRRGIENVIALLFGISPNDMVPYARLSFADRAQENGVRLPSLAAFVSNRVTMYGNTPSAAFRGVAATIGKTVDRIYDEHPTIFADSSAPPSSSFLTVPDYHAACIVASVSGTPIHNLQPGPYSVGEETTQLNRDPLDRYRESLEELVRRL